MDSIILNLLKSISSVEQLKSVLDDEKYVNYLNNLFSDEIRDLILSYNNDDIKIYLIELLKTSITFDDLISILETIHNDDYKKTLINSNSYKYHTFSLIRTLEDDLEKEKYILDNCGDNLDFYCKDMFIAIKSDEIKKRVLDKYINKNIRESYLFDIIMSFNSDEIKINYLDFIHEETNDFFVDKLKIVLSLKNKENVIKIISKDYLNNVTATRWIEDNLTDEEKYNYIIQNTNLEADYIISILESISSNKIKLNIIDNEIIKSKILNQYINLNNSLYSSDGLLLEFIKYFYCPNDKSIVNFFGKYDISTNILFSLIVKINDDDIKLNILNKYKDKIDNDIIILILDSFKNDQFKIDYIKNNTLSNKNIIDIISSIDSDDIKLQFIKEHYPRFISNNFIFESFKSYSVKFDLFKYLFENKLVFLTPRIIPVHFKSEENEQLNKDLIKYLKELKSKGNIDIYTKVLNYYNNIFRNSIKNESDILFIYDNNIEKIYMKDISDKNKYNYLINNWDTIGEKKFNIVESIIDSNLKNNIIKLHFDEIYNHANGRSLGYLSTIILDYVLMLSDDEKIIFVNSYELDHYDKLRILNSINDNDLKKEKLFSNFDSYKIIEDLSFINDDNISVVYIREKKSDIDNYSLFKIIKNINSLTIKVGLLDEYKLELQSSYIGEIIISIDDEEIRKSLLKIYMDRLDTKDVAIIVSTFSPSTLEKIGEESINNLIMSLFKNYELDNLFKLYNNSKSFIKNEKIDIIVSLLKKMDNYIVSTTFINLISNDIDNFSTKELINISVLVKRIYDSNSLEIVRLSTELIESLKDKDFSIGSDFDYFNQIESIFLKNNLPMGIKLFEVFKIIHPNLNGLSIFSPILNDNTITLGKKYELLMNDMLKITFKSNPYNTYRYIDDCISEIALLKKIVEIKSKGLLYSDIDLETKKIVDKIIAISSSWASVFKFSENDNNEAIYNYINDNLISGFENWIVNIFNDALGIEFASLDKIKEYVELNALKTSERNKKIANMAILGNYKFKLEPGDLIKGVSKDIIYLHSMLENGINCQEFLGSNASSDATNLDTDFSMISNNSDDINIAMSGTTASSWSRNLWIVLKNRDDRFNLTSKVVDGVLEYYPNNINDRRMELFKINSEINDNYGIRSGVPTSEIDYLIVNEYDSRIGFDIACNGFYIPVVNKKGQVVFTPEDYDILRSKMQGLSYYYSEGIVLNDDFKTSGVNDLIEKIRKDRIITTNKKKIINSVIDKNILSLGYNNVVHELNDDLSIKQIELIDTGSTSRGNNKPNDCDFDFILRMDSIDFNDVDKREKLSTSLEDMFVKLEGVPNDGNNPPNRLRYKDIVIEGIDEKLEIDISIIRKTNNIGYTTNMALLDKMNNIRKYYKEDADYVSANIVLAKAILKSGKCYKKPEGGMGGVGVENWILQNGGSVINAIDSFLEAANNSNSFQEFQNNYPLFDFGENFYFNENSSISFAHDNFTHILTNSGYENMKKTLQIFKNNYSIACSSGVETKYINNIIDNKDLYLPDNLYKNTL